MSLLVETSLDRLWSLMHKMVLAKDHLKSGLCPNFKYVYSILNLDVWFSDPHCKFMLLEIILEKQTVD
jgi:hypothetical protein